mmetsp:Transcript_56550/g.128212  ORF Transcript_56550/g.128212 Transcript_56550/m.128212 type:complete len:190 (+) Transcript_56550:1-570(+)
MDADDELSLDMNEMGPFYETAFELVFEIQLNDEQTEALFHIMDTDGSSELGFAEFVLFIAVIKKMEGQCKADPSYAKELFQGAHTKFTPVSGGGVRRQSSSIPAEKDLILQDVQRRTSDQSARGNGHFSREAGSTFFLEAAGQAKDELAFLTQCSIKCPSFWPPTPNARESAGGQGSDPTVKGFATLRA